MLKVQNQKYCAYQLKQSRVLLSKQQVSLKVQKERLYAGSRGNEPDLRELCLCRKQDSSIIGPIELIITVEIGDNSDLTCRDPAS